MSNAGGFVLPQLTLCGQERIDRLGPELWGMVANKRLKRTGAAILVFRVSTSLQAAPAA